MSQRYVPSSEPRYNRDRSPPRNPDRYAGTGAYPGRSDPASRPDAPAAPVGQAGVSRDPPRGPKALVDTPRGPGASSGLPAAPRGRGFAGRGDLWSGDYRERESRDPRASPPYADRDRQWRDRDFDRRDRRPSPRARHSQPDLRDFRDQPLREPDAGRPRVTREGPPAGPGTFSERGGYSRGRGKGDWDTRGRGRSSYPEERDFHRQKSPSRDGVWDREVVREDKDADRRDDRSVDRRDSGPTIDRDDRDRDPDRFRRDPYSLNADSKRTSAPSTAPSTPAPPSHLGQPRPPPAERPGYDADRDGVASRRMSMINLPGSRRDSIKSESGPSRADSTREAYPQRPSSPPQAPPVPAFGSLPVKAPSSGDPAPWNVWRASTEPKATQVPSNVSIVGTLPAKAVPTAPRSDLERQPPRGPKAERVPAPDSRDATFQPSQDTSYTEIPPQMRPRTPPSAPSYSRPSIQPGQSSQTTDRSIMSPRLSAPRQPASHLNPPPGPSFNQGGHRAPSLSSVTSLNAGPTFSAPSGPRARQISTSPTVPFIPTGPKAERNQFPPKRPPLGPQAQASWQWRSQAPPSQPASLVPTKRDAWGDAKDQVSHGRQVETKMENMPAQGHNRFDDGSRGELREEGVFRTPIHSPRPSESPMRQRHEGMESFVDDEDHMDLDELDFAQNETKFQREKAHLESKMFDLSSRIFRATTPLEHLAILSQLLVQSSVVEEDSQMADADGDSKTARTDFPTPSAEDREDSIMAEYSTPRQPSTPPIGTPELSKLPFLNPGLATPVSELEMLQESRERAETQKPGLIPEIIRELQLREERQDGLREEFRRLYKPWKRYTKELDRLREEEERQRMPSAEPKIPAAPPETSPLVPLPTPTEGRRSHKFSSEYEIEKAMEESAKMFQEALAKQEREALNAKPNPEKEAVVPEMSDILDRRARPIKDITRLRDPGLAYVFFELQPPQDDFTQEEHMILVHNFKEYPKKWGKLAQALPGRTYKECINHYYATKWSGEYKPPKDKRKQRRAKGPVRGTGRPKANALMSNLEIRPDVYQGDEFNQPIMAMTDSGRPRRAAAPTFGEKDTDGDNGMTQTPGRRNGRGDTSSDANADKSAKKPRGPNKEKGQRRAKNQSVTAVSRASPAKDYFEYHDPRVADSRNETELKAREVDAADDLASMQAQYDGEGRPHIHSKFSAYPGEVARQQAPQRQGPNDGAKVQGGQQTRVGPSSYWSVQEVNAFPIYLEHFGTDWQSIANQMGSKSQTMVKNYYTRLVNSNNRPDLEDLAKKGNMRRERGEEIGPPPNPVLNTKRRSDILQPAAPRALAPSTDVGEVGEDVTPPLVAQASNVQSQSHLPPSIVPNPSQPMPAQGPHGAHSTAVHSSTPSHFSQRQERDIQIMHEQRRDPHNNPAAGRPFVTDAGYPQRHPTTQEAPHGHRFYQPADSYAQAQADAHRDQQWQASAQREQAISSSAGPYPPARPTSTQPQYQRQDGVVHNSPPPAYRPAPSLEEGRVDDRMSNARYRPAEPPQPQSGHRYSADILHQMPRASSSMYGQPTHASPPLRAAETRPPLNQPQAAPSQAPPPRTQPEARKSNLFDLLNPSSEPEKTKPQPASRADSSQGHAQSPAATSSYPYGHPTVDRPASNPSAAQLYGDRRPYQLGSAPRSAHPSSASRSFDYENREPVSLQRTSSADYASRSSYPSLGSASASLTARPYERAPDAKSLFDSRASLQSLQARQAPAQLPQHGSSSSSSSNQLHQTVPPPRPATMASSQPSQALQQNPYGQSQNAGLQRPPPPVDQQNQQPHQQNSAYPYQHRPRQLSDQALSWPPQPTEPDYRQREQQQQPRDDQYRREPQPARPGFLLRHEQEQEDLRKERDRLKALFGVRSAPEHPRDDRYPR